MGNAHADPVSSGRVVLTGAGGQLGRALLDELTGENVLALTRVDWDVTQLPPRALLGGLMEPALVLHAAAYTAVDAAEGDPGTAEAVNVLGTHNAVSIGADVDALLNSVCWLLANGGCAASCAAMLAYVLLL